MNLEVNVDPLQIFNNFNLDALEESWYDEVWKNEFWTFSEPPADYSILLGSEDIEEFLKTTTSELKRWMESNRSLDDSSEEQRKEVSWSTLNALDINVRGLLAVLGYLIKTGQISGADEDCRQACLASTSLYFILLSIPASTTFHVFHPNLYQRALETFKLSEHLMEVKKPIRSNNLEALYSNESDGTLLRSEKKTLTESLNCTLYDLLTMLRNFNMKFQIESLEVTIMHLVEITKLNIEYLFFCNDNRPAAASLSSLSFNAYVALQNLCDERHGNIQDTVRLITKHFFPHLLPDYLDLPPKPVSIVTTNIVNFLRNLLYFNGDHAQLGIKILIQHLLTKAPKLVDARQKQAAVISKLICICRGDLFIECIQYLTKLTHFAKVANRIFAQEIIGKLLTEILIEVPEEEINLRQRIKKEITATCLNRCSDVSSLVRGKAMSVVEGLCKQNFQLSDFVDDSDYEKPFSSLDQLLVAIVTDFNALPGRNTFIKMIISRVKDERAPIRRNAIHCIEKLVPYFPTILQEIPGILSQHCRDPALSVRQDAIQALTDLLQDNPDNRIILHEYVKSVLPRVYDVEVKVQDKVLTSLQNTILNRITIFQQNGAECDALPWGVIKKITDEKMRTVLSKACDLWKKKEKLNENVKIIDKALVSKIQSHIGSKRNTEAWVMLACLGEFVKLPNMVDYYQSPEVFYGNNFLSSIMLEVLAMIWPTLKRDFLLTLYHNIFENLSKYRVSLESVSISIDILYGISEYFAETEELPEIFDLVKLSEAHIDNMVEVDDVDESTSVYLKAMSTLGHASLCCTVDVSESTINILLGLLLGCEKLKCFDDKKDVKAVAVVVLAQQALRNRDTAEKVMPIFGNLMCQSKNTNSPSEAAIRINAVKALADLCIRFTALVEPYLPDMCICMKDPNPLVRENIVEIFVQLLLEDYIKVKGAFFYHILTMLSDPDEKIRELTIFLIRERLLTKNKTLIAQSFVTSIFHYNNCDIKHKISKKIIREKEKKALTLPGPKNQSSRQVIYDFMLEHLDPANKLKILQKLYIEGIDSAAEKLLKIENSEAACVLKDVMYIIANNRLLPNAKVLDDDLNECDEIVPENLNSNNPLKKIVDDMKKFKLETVIPTTIKLRKYLLSCSSNLSSDVTKFLFHLMSELSKDQISELCKEHSNLKKEYELERKRGKKLIMDDADDSDAEETENNKNETSSASEDEENTFQVQQEKIIINEKEKSIHETPKKSQVLKDVRIVLKKLSNLSYDK